MPRNSLIMQYFLIYVLASGTTKSIETNTQRNRKYDSKVPSIRFQNINPLHSNVDLSASCPRCLAAAANKPNGGDGEFDLRLFDGSINIETVHVSGFMIILLLNFIRSDSR